MKGINKEICEKVKQLRRAQGISQSELAKELGCNQSAISMFEKGDPTKLNDEAVEKLAAKFSISLSDYMSKGERQTAFSPSPVLGRGYCPNDACPSNSPYEVEGRRLFLPDRLRADPVCGKFCALCGEVLEKRCPNCGAPVHDGAICSFCASPYVAAP